MKVRTLLHVVIYPGNLPLSLYCFSIKIYLPLHLDLLLVKHSSQWFPRVAVHLMQRPLAADNSVLCDNLQRMRPAVCTTLVTCSVVGT